MPTIYFPEKHKMLVEELCTKKSAQSQQIFPLYRDLMLFAAMVGKRLDRKAERVGNGGEVESNYFSSRGFNKEGVIYLLGLLEFENPDVLKDGAPDCWKLFEQYCSGGMDIISDWLIEEDDLDNYSKIFQDRLLEIARKSKKVPITIKRPKIRAVT